MADPNETPQTGGPLTTDADVQDGQRLAGLNDPQTAETDPPPPPPPPPTETDPTPGNLPEPPTQR